MRRANLIPGILGLLLGCGVTEHADLVYDPAHEVTAMDIFTPDDPGTSLRPAVMLVHGGAWKAGTRRQLAPQAHWLARAGYVTATVGYRLGDAGEYPRSPRDVACALAFLRARADDYRIDPDRIALYGYSAGAHLGSLVAVASELAPLAPSCGLARPSPPAAVVSGAGPQDLALFGDAEAVAAFVGARLDEDPALFAEASPVTHVDADDPPFLLIHGTGDLIVDVDHSRAMARRLRAAGVRVRLLELAGGGHLLNPGPDDGSELLIRSLDTVEARLALIDFLDQVLGPP